MGRRRKWRAGVGLAMVACVAASTLALGVASTASGAVITCMAPGKRVVEVTSARNMTCLAAREDIDSFTDPFAPSFKTPGGYECTRIVEKTDPSNRVSTWRCAKGSKAYRFDRYGLTAPGVRVKSVGYDKTFRVTRCVNKGETDLVLAGTAPGNYRLRINAPGGRGSLSLSGGNEQDGIKAGGTVTSVRVGDAGDIVAAGRFSSGLSGKFTVTGECA